MSHSECAFRDVADELVRLRPRIMPADTGTINNAIDLLMSAHNFFVGDPPDQDEFDDEHPESAFTISTPPLKPLAVAEHARRHSFLIDWRISPGIRIASISFDKPSGKPVYDNNGRQIGTTAEILKTTGMSVRDHVKGGGA